MIAGSRRTVAAVHLRSTLAAMDLRCTVTAADLGAAMIIAAGRRHFRTWPAVPGWGAVFRPWRVGRSTALTTILALCLIRGSTHHCDAKHQYHFYQSSHDNGCIGRLCKPVTGISGKSCQSGIKLKQKDQSNELKDHAPTKSAVFWHSGAYSA